MNRVFNYVVDKFLEWNYNRIRSVKRDLAYLESIGDDRARELEDRLIVMNQQYESLSNLFGGYQNDY